MPMFAQLPPEQPVALVALQIAPAQPGAVPPRPPLPASERRAPVHVVGRVVDARTGAAIAGALVQQVDAVAAGISDKDGSFALDLDPHAPSTVVVSAPGYAPRRLAVTSGKRLEAALTAQATYVPTPPATPPPVLPNSSAEVAPLNSNVHFTYALRHQDLVQGATSISGNITNDFELGLRLRVRPWLMEAEGGHYQSRVDVPNVPSSVNPAFKPSVWEAGVRAGYLWAFLPELEGALQLGYRYRNMVPNNSDIPYTGTGLDVTQTQHAFGPVALAAWKPGNGRFVLQGSLAYYPLVLADAEDRSTPFAGSRGLDTRFLAGYEISPGLRLGAGYQLETWRGTGADTSNVFSVQLLYTPGGLPRGNEP